MTKVPGEHCLAQRAPDCATRAYVTATPSNPAGGLRFVTSGARSRPIVAAAAAHWRVSGAVGQTTAIRPIERVRNSWRATCSAGTVVPAPGAAAIRNGPSSQSAIAETARCCQGRSAVFEGARAARRRVGAGEAGPGTERGIVRDPPDGTPKALLRT